MYGSKSAPIETGEAYGPKNLDSYNSRAESYGFLADLKKTFCGSGDRLKVGSQLFLL